MSGEGRSTSDLRKFVTVILRSDLINESLGTEPADTQTIFVRCLAFNELGCAVHI
jgi:hypothetical protein